MKNTDELRAELSALESEVRDLAAADEVTDEQDARFGELVDLVPAKRAELSKAEKRDALTADVLSREVQPKPDDFQVMRKVESDLDLRTAGTNEVRDVARKLIDESDIIDPAHKEAAERTIRRTTSRMSGDAVARSLVATERAEYQSGFMKVITGDDWNLRPDEQRALEEARAMSTTGNAGGFGIPVLIDPTVLITDGTGLLGVLDKARVEQITTDAWKGVSAGNTAWSFDAEGAESSDDASTFAQPTVNTHKAQATVPFSIEIGQDYPSFASEMFRILRDGYEDLLADKMITGAGDGSNEPFGLFTAAAAQNTIDVATDNTFAAADIDAVYAAVPEKFRARGTWVMNVDVENDIRAFGSGTATSRFTVDQTQSGISLLNGKEVVLSDYAPAWAGTDAQNILVFGDLSNYLVAQRVGMTVEMVDHMFATGNNRPNGQRAWYAYARIGADLVVDNAVRLLKNITT